MVLCIVIYPVWETNVRIWLHKPHGWRTICHFSRLSRIRDLQLWMIVRLVNLCYCRLVYTCLREKFPYMASRISQKMKFPNSENCSTKSIEINYSFSKLLEFWKNIQWARRYSSSKLVKFRKFPKCPGNFTSFSRILVGKWLFIST